jgi:hypothetical protein
METDIFPEALVIFSQLTWLSDREDYVIFKFQMKLSTLHYNSAERYRFNLNPEFLLQTSWRVIHVTCNV